MAAMSFMPALLCFAVTRGEGVQICAPLSGKNRQRFLERQAFLRKVGHWDT